MCIRTKISWLGGVRDVHDVYDYIKYLCHLKKKFHCYSREVFIDVCVVLVA